LAFRPTSPAGPGSTRERATLLPAEVHPLASHPRRQARSAADAAAPTALALALAGDEAGAGPTMTRRDVSEFAQGMMALVRADPWDCRVLLWQELAQSLPDELGDTGGHALAGARTCVAACCTPTLTAKRPVSRYRSSWVVGDALPRDAL